MARAVTGRDIIACCGYHGWQDWYVGTTTRNRGVPEAVGKLTKPFAYNDLDSLHRIFQGHPGEVAAVIMEPVGVVEPEPGYLDEVRAICYKNGAFLIFDEIITGFRMALGGAQEHFGVTPDLAASFSTWGPVARYRCWSLQRRSKRLPALKICLYSSWQNGLETLPGRLPW